MNEHSSVSDVIIEIKNLLEGSFRSVTLIGEVSNLKPSGSGHHYFTISDRKSSLSCVLFRMDALRNPALKNVKNGDQVVLIGSIGVYAPRGSFQLIVKRVEAVGKGNLKEQYELLKKRLASEGLFDLDKKKLLPKIPKRVGVITALSAAGLQDFLNVYKRRTLWMDILISPAVVQGDAAPESIRKALFQLIKFHLNAPEDKKLDIIVLTRGGGSLEDLWAFNDEALAWDVFNCPIPTVSAIGHEVDYCILDMVADRRCETPSAAAEVLTQEQTGLITTLDKIEQNLLKSGQNLGFRMHRELGQYTPDRLMKPLNKRLNDYKLRLNQLDVRNKVLELTGFHDKLLKMEDLRGRLLGSFPNEIISKNRRVSHCIDMLRVMNPDNVLSRGYTYIKTDKNEIVTKLNEFDKLSSNENLTIKFHDGIAKVRKVQS